MFCLLLCFVILFIKYKPPSRFIKSYFCVPLPSVFEIKYNKPKQQTIVSNFSCPLSFVFCPLSFVKF